MLVMLPLWQVPCLYADLRGLQRGARARRPLAQEAVGSCVALGLSAWSMWRQMRGVGLRRALDVAMSGARRAREGV